MRQPQELTRSITPRSEAARPSPSTASLPSIAAPPAKRVHSFSALSLLPPSSSVQRDDDPAAADLAAPTSAVPDPPPALGTDVQVTYPFQLQVSTVYRGFDLTHLHGFLGTLGIGYEPSASVSFSAAPGAGPVGQIAIGLAN